MCDFKPGDEVVAIDDGGNVHSDCPLPDLIIGRVYVISEVGPAYGCDECGGCHGVRVEGVLSSAYDHWTGIWDYSACSFRRVQRRDLSAWLETATDFEEPTRAPVVEPV